MTEEQLVTQTVNRLLSARVGRCQVELPPIPTVRAAYAIQTEVARRCGGFATWKIAVSAEGELVFAPILAGTVVRSGTAFPAKRFHMIGLEGELLIELRGPFPANGAPMVSSQIRDRIVRINAAIEIVDTRLVSWSSAPTVARIADNASTGALVVGEEVSDWKRMDLGRPGFSLMVNGELTAEPSPNKVGDVVDAIEKLLAHARVQGIDLPDGVRVSTGSATGLFFVAEGDLVSLMRERVTVASAHF